MEGFGEGAHQAHDAFAGCGRCHGNELEVGVVAAAGIEHGDVAGDAGAEHTKGGEQQEVALGVALAGGVHDAAEEVGPCMGGEGGQRTQRIAVVDGAGAADAGCFFLFGYM